MSFFAGFIGIAGLYASLTAAYKAQFNQQAVGTVLRTACVSF